MKHRGNDLLAAWVGKQVARELVDREVLGSSDCG